MLEGETLDSHPTGIESDTSFTERLRRRDRGAWSELFDEHRDRIWRYALVRTGNRDDADDITSQVFYEALQSIHRYQYRGKPVLAWLYTIARNHTGKHVRQKKRLVSLNGVKDTTRAVDDNIDDALMLAEALRFLTADQADVIALRFFAGYSTTEITLALGKSCAAVYSLEVRAIGALRRQLQIRPKRRSGHTDKYVAPRV